MSMALARIRLLDKDSTLEFIAEPRKMSDKASRPRSCSRHHIQASSTASKQNREENQVSGLPVAAPDKKPQLAASAAQALFSR
jgi:hypothetical protein